MVCVNMELYHAAGYSLSQLRALEHLLELNPSVHWIKLNPLTGIYELVLDNSLMSCFRTCPSLFMETWVEGRKMRGGRSWILEFGSLFHKMIETYYGTFRNQNFVLAEWAVKLAAHEWHAAKMDFHSSHKEYILLNGFTGFATLLAGYAARFNADNERLRVIGIEIPFGRAKEVPLGGVRIHNAINAGTGNPEYLAVYLAGRIDVLVDDRESICPLDHKTKGTLRNDPSKFYEIDEGPTGYVYAVNSILPKLIASLNLEDALLQRSCNKIIMNYISKAPLPDPADRFKRLPIMKTQDQLESYRIRMLCTAEDIFHALIRYASTGNATRSTDRCTGMYGSDCVFLPVHRQSSKENEIFVLNASYVKGPVWNTEEKEKEKESI